MMFRRLIFLALVPFVFTSVAGQIRLPKIIASNMVLQRNQSVPVWGWCTPGKTVTVTFAGQCKQTVADNAGWWQINLKPLSASAVPQQMLITADTSTITLSNILVGEVWLASGQSNMEYVMNWDYGKPQHGADSAALALADHDPDIRLFKVEKKLGGADVSTRYGWQEAAGKPLAEFSVPAYFFAKRLRNALQVPVGIIVSAWGGSRIEPWTPVEAYRTHAAFRKEASRKPLLIDSIAPGNNYQSMIKPLSPFALRGFIWYQGESNCMLNEPGMRYAEKMRALIDSWRQQWGNDRLPFYSVLIAPYYYTRRNDAVPHTPETLPYFWEQQEATTAIPRTEIVSVTDLVDDLKNIHPSYKWEVGRRLALVALAKDYGFKSTVYNGPRYRQAKIEDGHITLFFDNANRLCTNDGRPPRDFLIAGADGRFVTATAKIADNSVVVFSNDVPHPVDVRFAWNETAMPNLVNQAGFPAFPFRTNALKWYRRH